MGDAYKDNAFIDLLLLDCTVTLEKNNEKLRAINKLKPEKSTGPLGQLKKSVFIFCSGKAEKAPNQTPDLKSLNVQQRQVQRSGAS